MCSRRVHSHRVSIQPWCSLQVRPQTFRQASAVHLTMRGTPHTTYSYWHVSANTRRYMPSLHTQPHIRSQTYRHRVMVGSHTTELSHRMYAASAHTSLRPSEMTLTLTSLSVCPMCLPLMSLTACPYDRVPDIEGHLRVTQMCVYMLRCVHAISTSRVCYTSTI